MKDYYYYLLLSFVFSAIFMKLLLPLLIRLKAGQSIREDGPKEHLKKAGTPTMGGLSILLSMLLCCLLSVLLKNSHIEMLSCFFLTLAYGLIGFYDDFLKVVKKQNEGLNPKQKIILQIAAALIFAFVTAKDASMKFPFLGNFQMPRYLVIIFRVFVIVAMTNAVNLTDGLDGLAASVTSVVAAFFMVSTNSSFAAVICGSCFGFLIYNHHPAKVFMGDTGSLALGAALSSVAMFSKTEWFLPLAGGIYVAEALSVIIQVFVFKTQNGRRFFRMAPLHHHFELGGWKETKIVTVFTFVSLGLCIIAHFGL